MNDESFDSEPNLVNSIRTGPWVFFTLAIVWSTLFWLTASWMSPGLDPSSSPVFLIGGAGPLIIALAFTHFRERAPIIKDYWARAFDPRRIHGRWWVAALLMHPAIILLALGIDLAMGGPLPSTDRWPATLFGFLSLAFFTFWFGPLPEEMAWRGFAQDRLQLRMNPLAASLLLGAVWSAWHIPLFFIPGTFQHGLGAGSARFWIFMGSNIPLSVLMGWVYNHTSRSTLSAALIHFSGNLCGALVPKTDRVAALELLVLAAAAVAVSKKLNPPTIPHTQTT